MNNVYLFGRRVDVFEGELDDGFALTQPDAHMIEDMWDSGNISEPGGDLRAVLWDLLVSPAGEFACFITGVLLVVAMILAPQWWPL